MGYMQGAGQKGLEFVAKVTKLLNSLTEEDYEDTYVYVKVLLVEEDSSPEERVLGYWMDEHGPGFWAYFDGEPRSMKKPEPVVLPSLPDFSEIRDAINAEVPNNHCADDSDVYRMTEKVVALFKSKGF